MTDINIIRNKVQDRFLESIVENKYKGTITASVAIGKSFVAYKFIARCIVDKIVKKRSKWVMYSYTTKQGENLEKERYKYEEIFGKLDIDLIFLCYASKKIIEDVDGVIGDEFDVLGIETIKPFLFYKNKGIPTLMMSGTSQFSVNPISDIKGVRQSNEDTKKGLITDAISKAQLYEIYLPKIILSYSYEDALKDKLVKPLETRIIRHTPDKKNKVIYGSANKPKLTEFEYLTFKKFLSTSPSIPIHYRIQVKKQDLPRFFWRLPSKVDLVKDYLKYLKGNVIIFGQELSLIRQITPYVVTQKNTYNFTVDIKGIFVYYTTKTTKSKKGNTKTYFAMPLKTLKKVKITKEKYDKARALYKEQREEDVVQRFLDGEINYIGSSKAIGRAMNFNKVDHILFISYNSSFANMIQWLGRGSRLEADNLDKVSKLHFVVTETSQFPNKYEPLWFKECQIERDDKGNIINTINLNII